MAESFYLKNQADNEKEMGRGKFSRERTLLRVLKSFLSRISSFSADTLSHPLSISKGNNAQSQTMTRLLTGCT